MIPMVDRGESGKHIDFGGVIGVIPVRIGNLPYMFIVTTRTLLIVNPAIFLSTSKKVLSILLGQYSLFKVRVAVKMAKMRRDELVETLLKI